MRALMLKMEKDGQIVNDGTGHYAVAGSSCRSQRSLRSLRSPRSLAWQCALDFSSVRDR